MPLRRLLPALLVLAACPGDDAPTDTDTEIVDSDTTGGFGPVQAVLDGTCATPQCHGAAHALTKGLVLTADASYDMLVDVPSVEQPTLKRVAPGDLEGSWLWHKINGTMSDVDPTDSTDAMPPPFGLAGEDVEVIRAWILAGAPE